MAKHAEAKAKVGELIITGFEGKRLSDETAAFLSQAGIGGIIYFTKNYESPEQIAELSNQIQACRKDLPLWISVDHEGGKVQRFRAPFTLIPEAADIAATGSPKLAFEIAEVMAKELKAVGVNLNYTPVADINTNPQNPIIGRRSFGATDDEASKYVTAMVRGHVTHGVQACAKHFPGHGDTTVDSHLGLPTVDTDLETLRDREFGPFSRAFKSRCAFVMTAHIVMSKIDPKQPATLSPHILKKILREELRYSKVIMSDDLEMQAITDHYGPAEAPVLALNAGCDLLIYRTEGAARIGYEAIQKALDDGKLAPEVVLEAADRIRTLKEEVLSPYEPVDPTSVMDFIGTAENQALVAKVTKK